jgi:hypothetical protein
MEAREERRERKKRKKKEERRKRKKGLETRRFLSLTGDISGHLRPMFLHQSLPLLPSFLSIQISHPITLYV